MSSVGSLVAAGRTSDVYEYGAGVVVKVPRPQVPRHWASKEARFTAAVRRLGAPAPEVIEVVEVDGRDAIVFERVEGRSMWDLILEAPAEVDDRGRELAEIHRRILRCGLPPGIDGLVDRIRSKIEAAPDLSDADRTEAVAVVGRLPRGAALLHGDLHPGNVLMSADGPVVIDWFDASIGHPVADVVRSSILMRPLDGAAIKPHLPDADPALLGRLHDAYVEGMAEALARHDDLREWEAVLAAGRLAEDAEADGSGLLALWESRHAEWRGPLAAAVSGQ